MNRIARLLLAATAAVAIAGCAHTPLKAPCAPDEGGLTVAYSSLRAAGPGAIVSAPAPSTPSATRVGCGPLKPI